MPARKFQPFLLPEETPQYRGEPISVSELNTVVKALIDNEPLLQDVRVKGELSNVSRPASGHMYFTLKDGSSRIRCAMWKMQVLRMGAYRPRDGDAVVARGKVGVFERDGQYQLYVEALAPQGVGDLYAEFERLKARLQAEGLFDAERKRELPQFPRVLGVATSPTAAAFQDILNVLRRRWPLLRVLLSPTLVQGSDAPPQIVRAIHRLNALTGDDRPDVILVARGGGSLEELWAFNDERVVRAIVASDIPVISGVGHEVDFTLADFAADVRAPTPSAAAELLTPDVHDIQQWVDGAGTRIAQLTQQRLADARAQLQSVQRALRALSPMARVAASRDQLTNLRARLLAATTGATNASRARLALAASRLDAYSPQATLARGYALVQHANGALVRSVNDVAGGDALKITVRDGEFGAIAQPLPTE